MNFAEYLKQKYGTNEPIYLEDIRYKDYSRSWIFNQLKKLVDSGVLKRFDTGVYYFPEQMFFGSASLDPGKVVQKKYLTDGENVYGYITGLSLLNSVGLSTQCPNLLELASNNESSRVRDIKVGFQKVRARRARAEINKDNVNALQLLDLMNVISFRNMDETERQMLSNYIRSSGVTKSQILQYAKLYPAKAMKNLIESGAIYDLAQ